MTNRVLIIDDENHIRQMMRLTLEAAGYEVGDAHDGPTGLALYGDGSQWAAVILDQRMAGMDGLETLRRIKEKKPDARVVMATAYASIELAVDAMKLGATDFIRKPMSPETLRNAVAVALTKPSPRAVLQETMTELTPAIQTITMNGFTVTDDEEIHENQRRFIVTSPDGQQHEVVVDIHEDVLAYVERMTGHRLSPENSFWTAHARHVLTDFVWEHGDVPRMRRLVVRDLDPDALLVAARWRRGQSA